MCVGCAHGYCTQWGVLGPMYSLTKLLLSSPFPSPSLFLSLSLSLVEYLAAVRTKVGEVVSLIYEHEYPWLWYSISA